MQHVAPKDSQQQFRRCDHFDSSQEANNSDLGARELQNQFDGSSSAASEEGQDSIECHFQNEKPHPPPHDSSLVPGKEPSPTQTRDKVSRIKTHSLTEKLVDLASRLLAVK